MAYFLAKTDPDTYSIDQFEGEGVTTWDGVTNPTAVRAIGQMVKGDMVFLYHSGPDKAILGLAEVVSAPSPDKKNPKSKVVDMKFVRRLDPPTTLSDIKNSGLFEDFALVRQGRLSTMPCPDKFVEWLRKRYPRGAF